MTDPAPPSPRAGAPTAKPSDVNEAAEAQVPSDPAHELVETAGRYQDVVEEYRAFRRVLAESGQVNEAWTTDAQHFIAAVTGSTKVPGARFRPVEAALKP